MCDRQLAASAVGNDFDSEAYMGRGFPRRRYVGRISKEPISRGEWQRDVGRKEAVLGAGQGGESSHPFLRPLGIAVLFVVVVLMPLLTGSHLLLLDWTRGPRVPLDPSLWGFPGTPASSIPFFALLHVVSRLPLALGDVLPPILFAALIAAGMNKLFSSHYAASLGALFLLVNPFVYDRLLVGHFALLLAYGLLPFAASTMLPGVGLTRRRHFAAVSWSLLLIAIAPHMLFVGVPLMLLIDAISHRRGERVGVVGAAVVAGIAASAYWLIPLSTRFAELDRLGALDVTLFRTTADPRYGLLPNVLGLHGFWRPEFVLSKSGTVGWPLLLAALLLVVGVGIVEGVRSYRYRRLSVALVAGAAAAVVLAVGDRGPTGAFYLFLFNHVPGFKIMREPQKFLLVLAFSYAYFYALGSEALLEKLRGVAPKVVLFALLFAAPCLYTYKMFWGFGGQVKPSKFPSSWEQADRIMGEGPERALALPWHLYMAFPWTQGRTVANPAPSYFRRDVIAGDNIELGRLRTQSTDPRSAYLRFLFDHSESTPRFGNLVAPLGIRYVLLMKEQDWKAYDWLYRKTDLKVVMDTPDLAVFENLEPVSLVYAPRAEAKIRDWDQLLQLADEVRLTDYAIRLDPNAPSQAPPLAAQGSELAFRRTSPVNYALAGTDAQYVTLAEPFDHDWSLAGHRAEPNFGVTNLFPGGVRAQSSIYYTRWRLQLLGYGVSAVALTGTSLVLLRGRRRSIRSRARERGAET